MIKTVRFCLLFLLLSSVFRPVSVSALENPLAVPNNKYGIHIIDENDLDNAAALVNSSGGDWGYVTMVITQNDRNPKKWQNIFNRMKGLHLIPIIRLATGLENNVWKKPQVEEAVPWADFLNSLDWVINNRYVILFNEPNHAKEYGGTVEPKDYGEIIWRYSEELKKKSGQFFVLPAGLDASAPNSRETMDEEDFLKAMISSKPEVFSNIDGWSSHSYPNPGFAGRVAKVGRGSLKTYLWERKILRELGFDKQLPVFITETGWVRRGDNADIVADYFSEAADSVWNDTDIVAVTPFILNYQSLPFTDFSWQKQNSFEFYPQFDSYRSIPKTAGDPVRKKGITQITPQAAVLSESVEKAGLGDKIVSFVKLGYNKVRNFLTVALAQW
ncbi:hypothetical protein MUP32_02635 [Candidatus Microgenomates bacterium]|nr:hypothetical protein [Candidatus Microgenomates bacterium]